MPVHVENTSIHGKILLLRLLAISSPKKPENEELN